jgi:UDP-N-acetylglucosamine--N-acetylmuramyl-(pentapeptide) pyrophosphoryl-undecaprenol N-acetylglucosamine transferase
VYPALAVLKALTGNEYDSLLWVGGEGGMEADLVKREGVAFTAIPAAGVHGVSLLTLPRNLWKLGRGLLAARAILRRFQPDVMFFTGGYVAVPVALAGRLPGLGKTRPAQLVFVPDIEPGLALRTLARFADRIAVSVKETRAFLPGGNRVTVTGYPARRSLLSWTPEAARQAFGFSSSLPTLLVSGGSSGARSINRALLPVLPELLPEMQILHISGNLDWPEVAAAQARLEPGLAERYRAYPYLHAEMGAAMAVADLVVSRAGASTLGEYPLFGLPAILVPYPYAWRYQHMNARYLEARGAALVVKDEDLPGQLAPLVRQLVHSPSRRRAMREAMKSLAKPAAANSIADLLRSLGSAPGRGRE